VKANSNKTGCYLVHPTCQIAPHALSKMYENAFGFKMDGTFVECGAYDGRSYSNTWGLAVMGWKGLYIEPYPAQADRCVENHVGNDVVVERVAVGRNNGETWLYQCGDVSSIKWNKVSRAWGCIQERKIMVKVEMLDHVLDRHDWPKNFDLLVIDVEGSEEDVLRGFSLWRWRPKMVIVELHEKSPATIYKDEKGRNRRVDFANGYFRDKYRKVYADDVNTIFVRREDVKWKN